MSGNNLQTDEKEAKPRKNLMLSSSQAAKILNLSLPRVQQLIRSGRLPAVMVGKTYVIRERDLRLVENRKPGRPSLKTLNQELKTKTKGKERKTHRIT
jgi:excisionase family DNA binding protein